MKEEYRELDLEQAATSQIDVEEVGALANPLVQTRDQQDPSLAHSILDQLSSGKPMASRSMARFLGRPIREIEGEVAKLIEQGVIVRHGAATVIQAGAQLALSPVEQDVLRTINGRKRPWHAYEFVEALPQHYRTSIYKAAGTLTRLGLVQNPAMGLYAQIGVNVSKARVTVRRSYQREKLGDPLSRKGVIDLIRSKGSLDRDAIVTEARRRPATTDKILAELVDTGLLALADGQYRYAGPQPVQKQTVQARILKIVEDAGEIGFSAICAALTGSPEGTIVSSIHRLTEAGGIVNDGRGIYTIGKTRSSWVGAKLAKTLALKMLASDGSFVMRDLMSRNPGMDRGIADYAVRSLVREGKAARAARGVIARPDLDASPQNVGVSKQEFVFTLLASEPERVWSGREVDDRAGHLSASNRGVWILNQLWKTGRIERVGIGRYQAKTTTGTSQADLVEMIRGALGNGPLSPTALAATFPDIGAMSLGMAVASLRRAKQLRTRAGGLVELYVSDVRPRPNAEMRRSAVLAAVNRLAPIQKTWLARDIRLGIPRTNQALNELISMGLIVELREFYADARRGIDLEVDSGHRTDRIIGILHKCGPLTRGEITARLGEQFLHRASGSLDKLLLDRAVEVRGIDGFALTSAMAAACRAAEAREPIVACDAAVEAVDVSRSEVNPAMTSVPQGEVMTDHMRRALAALSGPSALRKTDVATALSIGRGSANRIVDRLVRARRALEISPGLFQAQAAS